MPFSVVRPLPDYLDYLMLRPVSTPQHLHGYSLGATRGRSQEEGQEEQASVDRGVPVFGFAFHGRPGRLSGFLGA